MGIVLVSGMFGAGIALIGLSFLDCTKTVLAVVLLIAAVTISGSVYSGYFVNHMDIAPQYAGTLMGIANGLAASSGFIAPYIASVVTKSVGVVFTFVVVVSCHIQSYT